MGGYFGTEAQQRLQELADAPATRPATRVHEYVAADNTVSRRTVEASGLRLVPDLVGGAVTRDGQRFTR